MKKILFLAFVVGLIANCYSIDKTKVGGKDVITATQLNPVFLPLGERP
ncbi:hypothetical protein LEP1GSC038_2268 [Leptospira weilii str. 2006001855]|uniref:Uncharacterized protein n=1 Tax=Leptospira weilii str. 2006001855 TaxID=996804 RepID=M6FS47_9LEPT|nr:hypothetical protein LEP1GSC038_2268 [Leptospira weilii str. 2006001855]